MDKAHDELETQGDPKRAGYGQTDETSATKKTRLVDLLIAIAVLGSVWGFLEVVVGGAIKAAGLPQRCSSPWDTGSG